MKQILILVLLVSLVLIGVTGCTQKTEVLPNGAQATAPVTTEEGYSFDMDGDAQDGSRVEQSQEEVQAALNQQVADGMMNISMNLTPVFDNGSAAGNLLIMNEHINKYLQVVEIYRDDTKELIYKSGGIPVGSRVDNAKLKVALPKGEYKATAYFLSIDTENGNQLKGKAGAALVITILN